MREGVHEGGNNESNKEGNVKGNSCPAKDRWQWRGFECDLVDDAWVFIASGCVITCDPREAILDDQHGECHIGFNTLYCSNIVLAIMIIWKWMLFQTILDGYIF